MAYDEGLETRIDELPDQGLLMAKRKMFGGIGYLVNGNMAFGIWQDSLVVRCGGDAYQACLAQPGVDVFDVTGRPMCGWVLVRPSVIAEDATLAGWLQRGLDFALTLEPK